MRSHLPSLIGLTLALSTFTGAAAVGQDYKVAVLKEAPPSSLAPKVSESLNKDGFRVVDGDGKPFADIWLRKSIPAAGAPEGIKGAIQFPFLAEGEFLGVLKFAAEGHDYRDQTIPKGVYTIRYGLQPVNGDHLGVSVYRDYVLLIPAAKDTDIADIPRKPLHEKSAESAGASHPACLLLVIPASPPTSLPSMAHDEEKATWGANLPLNLGVKGSKEAFTQTIQFIVVGASMG